jgi:hypothetical protein
MEEHILDNHPVDMEFWVSLLIFMELWAIPGDDTTLDARVYLAIRLSMA